ncbi:helix-turn-helix domain-containing protein [Bacillus sp. Gen3]|nr:helix-turn-helix domain-containing protein [Bacillus sp. Gen3]
MKPVSYKDDEFIHFIYKDKGEFVQRGKGENKKEYPKKEKIEIPFNEIEKMNLNKNGESIPYSRNNVVNLERYLLWYWSPIIGGEAIILFLHLWEYCNQDEGVDICYPKITELCEKMGKSRPTINKILETLEENNFLVVIHRLNKESNNRETSPIYKLRQTVPLLSKEQYLKLSPKLQAKHDEYMQKFVNDKQLEYFTYDVNETIETLLSKGDKIISKSARAKIKEIINSEKQTEHLISILPESIRLTLKRDSLLDALERVGMSKPMRDTFYKDMMSIYIEETETVHLLVNDNNLLELLSNETSSFGIDRLFSALQILYNIENMKIEYYTIEQYFYKLMKGL